MYRDSSPVKIAESYLDALEARDFEKIRNLLSKEKFSFVGPIDKFNDAESLIQALQRLAPIIKRIEKRKTFADGHDVCIVYNLVTDSPAGTARCTELSRIHDGKITSIEVFFDASPFLEMFRKQ